jgi:hypothetical protein
MIARLVGMSFASPTARGMCRSAHAYPAAPDQLPFERSARGTAARGSRIRMRAKVGQNLKFDMHILAKPRDCARGNGA